MAHLSEHFNAAPQFAAHLAPVINPTSERSDVYNLTAQIKAALVNIRGVTNIHTLTIQLLGTLAQTPLAAERPPVALDVAFEWPALYNPREFCRPHSPC